MKKWKILLLVGCFLSIILVVFLFLGKEQKTCMEMKDYREHGKNYDIQIQYPTFQDKKLNKKIKKTLFNKKKEFLKAVKELESNIEYELNISYDYSIVDDIYSIHFRIFSYLGGAHYMREDLIYYYDCKHKKEVSLSDLVLLDDAFYKEISTLSKAYLLENKDKLQIFEDDLFLEGVAPTKENYSYITFTNTLNVIMPPYQVAPWSSGEIIVPISYNSIKKYLNKEYFPSIMVTSVDVDLEEKEETKGEIKRDLESLKNKKLIAFTFDDGPNYSITENFLQELDKRQAKVSFFLLGERAIKQPNLVKLMYQKGHTIGSHTYDHKNLYNLKEEEILFEINKTNEVLEQITGVKPIYLRPPYGNYNSTILNLSPMAFILWNVDTNDWKYKDSDRIAKYIVENVKDGDIVLLHDLYQTSVDGVLKAMDELKEEYAFVSIDELATLKGITLEKNTAYRYIR